MSCTHRVAFLSVVFASMLWMVGCHCDVPRSNMPDGNIAMDSGVDVGGRDAARDVPINPTCNTPAQSCRSGLQCCPDGQECVNNYQCEPVCAGMRCGENDGICCGSNQICLDGVVCAAACQAGESLCGVNHDVCCGASELCINNACQAPSASCADDYDCLSEGTYCETVVGQCLNQPAPPLCEIRPDFDNIDLRTEWHWPGVLVEGKLWQNVIASPAVGDVSGDGIPDVVVAAYYNSADTDTQLAAIDGRTGLTLWNIGGANKPHWMSMVALANLDPSDDALEIVYKVHGGAIRVLDGNGATELATIAANSGDTGAVMISIADMNGDGNPEIIMGCRVATFAPSGAGFALTEIFNAGTCKISAQNAVTSTVANIDNDPELEVLTGGAAYDFPSGTKIWPSGSPTHALQALADLDGDGDLEVANVRSGQVSVRDARTGTLLVGSGGTWFDGAVTIPGGGEGGAPTIADFDGDGLPEIATAGSGCYVVYDPDCLAVPPRTGGACAHPPEDPNSTCDNNPSPFLRWAVKTQDISSSVTGSSVFDFQGDGVAEVVYNDECFLHVYDGRDGREILSAPRLNSSRTAMEYPLVVDVDGDGNSEIVVPGNGDEAFSRDDCQVSWARALNIDISDIADPSGAGTNAVIARLPAEYRVPSSGVSVYGDTQDRWVRTRRIWNQFSYYVTNVGEQGQIPISQTPNHTTDGLNNFRQNVQGAGVFNAPNLQVQLQLLPQCGLGVARLSAVVTNVGSRGAPAGAVVVFQDLSSGTAQDVGMGATQRPLLPGGSERITIEVPLSESLLMYSFNATVNGQTSTTTIRECNYEDNQSSAEDQCNPIQ